MVGYLGSSELSAGRGRSTIDVGRPIRPGDGRHLRGAECVEAPAPNGVAALLGVPGDWGFSFDGGAFHRDLVMHSKAMAGSVNSERAHFRAALDRLADLSAWFLDDYGAEVARLDRFEAAFDPEAGLKTAVESSAPRGMSTNSSRAHAHGPTAGSRRGRSRTSRTSPGRPPAGWSHAAGPTPRRTGRQPRHGPAAPATSAWTGARWGVIVHSRSSEGFRKARAFTSGA